MRRAKRLHRERLPWAFGLLAASLVLVANGNGIVRPRHLGVVDHLWKGMQR